MIYALTAVMVLAGVGLFFLGIAYEKIAHNEWEAAKPTPEPEKAATPRAFR